MKVRAQIYGPDHWAVLEARRGLEHLRPDGTTQPGRPGASWAGPPGCFASPKSSAGERKVKEAVLLAAEGVEIRKRILGERHRDYAFSLWLLALLYVAHNDYAHAVPLFEQALAIRKHTLGEDHPLYVNSLKDLADTYSNMQDYARALPLAERVLTNRRQTLAGAASRSTWQA